MTREKKRKNQEMVTKENASKPGSMPRVEPTQQTGRGGNKGARKTAGRSEQRPGNGLGETNYCNS